MSLRAVFMPPEVYYACTLHALTVEKEEIMGLLIGNFDNENNASIRSLIALQRSDKRKDRVEISGEQMFMAMEETNRLSDQLGEQVNVIGWYHSHPHITVEPSHVDLRTQANYQIMDDKFFGLIFSVFNEDKNMGHEMQVTCFQSVRGKSNPYDKKAVPLYIERDTRVSGPCLQAVMRLPRILTEEELELFKNCQSSTQNLLDKIENESTFVKSMCHIMRTTTNPLIEHLENRINNEQQRIKELRRQRTELMQKSRERRSRPSHTS